MTKTTIRAALFYLLAILLAGCATTASGPAFAPVKNTRGGVIYLYAPGGFGGYGTSQVVEVDGTPAGKLHTKGFLALKVAPGAHTVAIHEEASLLKIRRRVKVSVGSGGSAYLRVNRKFDGLAGGNIPIFLTTMEVVPNAIGAAEIRATRAST